MSTTIEEGLNQFLLATAGITNLVGTRVYGQRITQGSALPCITKQRISTYRAKTHDTSGAATLARARFQIDAWGSTEASVKSVADALRAALNGKSGSLGSGAISIGAALIEEEVAEYDPEANLYRSRSDYMIWQLES